jgi:galactose mutarotase-like enzyme
VSFGYHPYFRVPGASRPTWRLRMPGRVHLALDDRQLPSGVTTEEPVDDRPVRHRTYDDHYRLGDDRRFALEAAGRSLTVTFDTGYPYAQVYAPPRTQFLCIEPMTATVNALVDGTAPVVEPGHRYEATWSVSVTDV